MKPYSVLTGGGQASSARRPEAAPASSAETQKLAEGALKLAAAEGAKAEELREKLAEVSTKLATAEGMIERLDAELDAANEAKGSAERAVKDAEARAQKADEARELAVAKAMEASAEQADLLARVTALDSAMRTLQSTPPTPPALAATAVQDKKPTKGWTVSVQRDSGDLVTRLDVKPVL